MKNNNRIYDLVEEMVLDLESKRESLNCWAFKRTVRNVLIGKDGGAIAPYFAGKPYHGICERLSLEDAELILDHLVDLGRLSFIITRKQKKLYCTTVYYNQHCVA